MNCTRCGSENIKKNGHTHYGKQNYFCHDCGSQFVESGQDWFVSETEKDLIKKLLLERISLSGICRVCDVSESWLLQYIKELYSNLPDDLNANLVVPNLEEYLSARMDEEIGRIEVIKKIQVHLKSIRK